MLDINLCEEIIYNVLNDANIDDKNYIFDEYNSDLDRLYITIDNEEYCIRMWNISESGRIDYTLYKLVEDKGEEIESGYNYISVNGRL